jgi:hypothetical protein
MGLGEETLGEINPFVQLGHFLPQSIDLGEKLGIVGPLDPAPQPVGQGLAYRADREQEQSSSPEDECDGK